MPFQTGLLVPQLRMWDDHADEAAIAAQLFIMARLLQPTFNRTGFDGKIRRETGKRIANVHWQRLLTSLRPKLILCSVQPSPIEQLLRPDVVRATMTKAGHKPAAITRYLESAHYRLLRDRTYDALSLQAELTTRRYRLLSGTSHNRAVAAVKQGHVVLGQDTSGTPLLLVPAAKPAQVQVYDPQSGTSLTSFDRLRRIGRIYLDASGILIFSLP